MTKKVRNWLIIATSLVLVGGIIFGGVMTMLKWDFSKLSTVRYETGEYEINEDYKNISIITKTADILLVPSENSKTSVSCYEQKNLKHSVEVKDGTLIIEVNDSRNWYDHIGIAFGNPKITLNIPKGEFGELSVIATTGDIKIPKEFIFESIDISMSTGDITNYASASKLVKLQASTGDICAENISAGTLDLRVSTGEITVSNVNCENDVNIKVSTGEASLTNVNCKNISSSGNTGDILLKNVIAAEKFSIDRSTGDVKFDGSDAAEIFIKTNTGDVKGSLLTNKVFITQTNTGKIDVPKTANGGRCEITTDTGNIILKIN